MPRQPLPIGNSSCLRMRHFFALVAGRHGGVLENKNDPILCISGSSLYSYVHWTASEGRRVIARNSVFFLLAAAVIIAGLLLGGGTRSGFLSDVILQLMSIPLLLAALWRLPELLAAGSTHTAVLMALALVVLPLLQLIPLPPALWTALSGRGLAVETAQIVGQADTWRPLSLTPDATALSLISLLPPLSVFLAVLLLSYRERRQLSLLILAVGLSGVFIGLTQVAQGPASALRFFAVTHPHDATGFFASRNHFSALLYTLMLLAAAWTVDLGFASRGPRAVARSSAGSVLLIVAAFVMLVVLVAAQTMARSRMGLALTIGALLGAGALALADRRSTAGFSAGMKLMLGAVVLAGMLAAQLTLYRVLERFTSDPLKDARFNFAASTIAAARDYFPFGSGIGTFVSVYATYEQPAHAFQRHYVNHAHNDFLEIWLEAGACGIALMALFLLWLAARGFGVWRRGLAGARAIDAGLAKAATLAVLLLLVHSLVDYPLRTGALMAIFAFACALLVEPVAEAKREAEPAAPPREAELWRRVLEAAQPTGPLAPLPGALRPGERWGEDEDWPEAWRKPTG